MTPADSSGAGGDLPPPPAADASPIRFRRARREDLETLVALLADDAMGALRESAGPPLPQSYEEAFAAIDSDPRQELIVLTEGETVLGMMQLTFTPYLTYRGGWRATLEGVRIAGTRRGEGLGRRLFTHAIERARARSCHLVQLATDKKRPEALRFYERLGFAASHEGMKLHLGS